ncbi:MAG: RNA polymerase sigma-70 factor (ECF subfamily) [Oceanicoccus sp.]|jgi:RNA polymerase sigma-70 factor (ECF subfamily)
MSQNFRKLLHGLRNDESLMTAYRHGDSLAFESLYNRHKNGVFAYISRHCPANFVEEVAQETWVAIVKAAESYTIKAKFKTYLYHIAHNKIVDHWRRVRPDVEDIDTESLIDCKAGSIDQEYGYAELMTAIKRLPNEQRDAFLLREEGFSHEDIAAITGCGRETVKSRLRYAAQTLQKQLGGSS